MEARNTNTPSTKSPARSKMTTILLKILIPDHLYVFHHHGRGPSCRSQRSHLLADALGEGGYRLGEWPTDHDMYPHLVGTDDHAGYLLARPIGRDFHEAPGRQRVNPVCGEGRLRGGPRQLQVVGQESPVYLSARYCLPDPLLLLLLALLLREEHVVDSDVHLRDVEAHEVLHAVDDVLANGLGDLGDRLSVLDRQRYVDRGLNLADLHGDPARLAAAATDVAAGHAAQDPAY